MQSQNERQNQTSGPTVRSEGREGEAPAGQSVQLRGLNYSEQRDALAPGGLIQQQQSVIEVDQGNDDPMGEDMCTAPPITVASPGVTNIGAIADPVARNNAINSSYHALGQAMAHYTGTPYVANWCTYGKWASREAGTQIRNLQSGLDILQQTVSVLVTITVSRNPFTIVREARRGFAQLERIYALLQQPGLMQQSLQLALAKANITSGEIASTMEAWRDLAELTLTDMIPGVQEYELVNAGSRTVSLAKKMGIALPGVIEAVNRVYGNMVQGNRGIYNSIGPAYHMFLSAAGRQPDGMIEVGGFADDDGGYLQAAFHAYRDVRKLSNEMACMPEGAEGRSALEAERQQTAHRANLLIGYQEQLVILQPIFDDMQEELAAMAGTMVINDPSGVHPLIADWGDFYTRMGIDPASAPNDPTTVDPDELAALVPPSDPRYQGSINQYFSEGLNDRSLHDQRPTTLQPI